MHAYRLYFCAGSISRYNSSILFLAHFCLVRCYSYNMLRKNFTSSTVFSLGLPTSAYLDHYGHEREPATCPVNSKPLPALLPGSIIPGIYCCCDDSSNIFTSTPPPFFGQNCLAFTSYGLGAPIPSLTISGTLSRSRRRACCKPVVLHY